ncbi:hypothetical protein DWZ60_00255 [Blautia sp. AF34-10]|nr:hypothetical protein DWZ60_00255 [Blautia sp. AF34-10]
MGVYQILGGRRLCGTVTVQGSKNAVLPMIAAAVLTKEEVVLEGCPKISDVEDMAEIVRSLGGTVWWERNALHLNCEKIEKSRVEGALSKRLRASLLFLGSLLARTGEAYLAGAGGCRIGKRPTDLHQRAMELLGAEVSRRAAPFGQRQIIRKEPCSAFRKRASGRRKMRFFLLSERKVQQGWSTVRGSRKWFISAGFLRPWERRLPARGRSRLPFTEGGERDCCPAAGIVFRVTGSRQGRIF